MNELEPRELLKDAKQNWGWIVALGVAMVVMGAIAIGSSVLMTVAFVTLFGVLLTIGGVTQVAQAFMLRGSGRFWTRFLFGLLYVVAGILIVARPFGAAEALTLIVAAFLMASGLVRIFSALQTRHLPGWGWMVVSGVLNVLLASLIYAQWPASGLWVIGLFVGIEILMGGAACISAGLALKNLPSDSASDVP